MFELGMSNRLSSTTINHGEYPKCSKEYLKEFSQCKYFYNVGCLLDEYIGSLVDRISCGSLRSPREYP